MKKLLWILFVTILLLYFFWLFFGVCFSSNGSIQKQNVTEKIIEHVGKVFYITFIDEALFRVQVLHSKLLKFYYFVRFLVNIRAEETLPWKFLNRLIW